MKLARMKDCRVAVLGLGREGRSFCRVYARRLPGQSLTAFAEAAPAAEKDAGDFLERVRVEIGPFGEALSDFDILVRSPGVPVDHPAIVAAVKSGVHLVSPSSIWFSERPDVATIAVTGSKGKSTTAALLAHFIKAAGFRVVLAGNIGSPLLDHLDSEVDWVVAELSSYQLVDLQGRPSIAVVTRLFPEHQDWHGGAEPYFAAKLKILDLVGSGTAFVNGQDAVLMARCGSHPAVVPGNLETGLHGSQAGIQDGPDLLVGAGDLPLKGRHNRGNIALALEAGLRVGATMETMLAALPEFQPLEHRLQSLGIRGKVEWINDSISTSPQATLAALECLEKREVVLIAGGLERGSDWAPVFAGPERRLYGLIVIPDNGGRIASQARAGLAPTAGIHECSSLDEAVATARRIAPDGGVVLLSPGAPSFPGFANFEERGRRFSDLVPKSSD